MSDEPAPAGKLPGLREIDWSKAPFLSNELTLGQLRQAIGHNHDVLGQFVHNLVCLEQEVARHALSESLKMSAAGDARLVPQVLKEVKCRDLMAMYEEAGLMTGPHQAAEVLRDLEAWARAQASHRSGGPP